MKSITLWTALITPMKRSGGVHYENFKTLIHRQEEAGNGILLLGSTGEGLALMEEEKKSIVRFVSDLRPDVPLMVGVGGFQLPKQVEWIEYCNKLNIDAFLAVAPLYAKPGPPGQTKWFRELLDIADKPCMIYNIPSRTGVKIPPAVIRELSGHPRFWSVKEASGRLDDYQKFRETVPDVPLFSGDDGLLPVFATAGCAGLVSVASNVWPMETSRYVELCLNGATESLFPVWKQAVEALFSAPNPIPAKVLLNRKGIIETAVLRLPLTVDELKSTAHLLEADKAITNWYNHNKPQK